MKNKTSMMDTFCPCFSELCEVFYDVFLASPNEQHHYSKKIDSPQPPTPRLPPSPLRHPCRILTPPPSPILSPISRQFATEEESEVAVDMEDEFCIIDSDDFL